ncbi:MAG: DUF1178 family protein [Propylenella sp.]
MIRYTLVCPKAHEFEGWFAGSDAFEALRKKALLICPICGSTAVDRALMAPAVSTARSKEGGGRRLRTESSERKETGEGHDSAEPVRLAANVPEKQEIVAAMRKLRQHLTENADYVGNRFAEEARRIHYQETEKRGIYGEATREETRALAEEGIEFHPLPPLPEDHN